MLVSRSIERKAANEDLRQTQLCFSARTVPKYVAADFMCPSTLFGGDWWFKRDADLHITGSPSLPQADNGGSPPPPELAAQLFAALPVLHEFDKSYGYDTLIAKCDTILTRGPFKGKTFGYITENHCGYCLGLVSSKTKWNGLMLEFINYLKGVRQYETVLPAGLSKEEMDEVRLHNLLYHTDYVFPNTVLQAISNREFLISAQRYLVQRSEAAAQERAKWAAQSFASSRVSIQKNTKQPSDPEQPDSSFATPTKKKKGQLTTGDDCYEKVSHWY
jgi:hypothetical protein